MVTTSVLGFSDCLFRALQMMSLLTGGTISFGPGPPRRTKRIGIGNPIPITVRLPIRKLRTNVHHPLRTIIIMIMINIIPTTDRKRDNGYRRSNFQIPLNSITIIIIIITTDDRNRNHGYSYVKFIVWISSSVRMYEPSVTYINLFALPSDMLMNSTHHSDEDWSMSSDRHPKIWTANRSTCREPNYSNCLWRRPRRMVFTARCRLTRSIFRLDYCFHALHLYGLMAYYHRYTDNLLLARNVFLFTATSSMTTNDCYLFLDYTTTILIGLYIMGGYHIRVSPTYYNIIYKIQSVIDVISRILN